MKYNEKLEELLGILQSINYDRIINELEIASLNKWISENCNIEDPRFQEIIKNLNKILEDNKITEEEKIEIIKIIDKYYDICKYSINISELIGIVEGIISDNDVNLDEMICLNNWIKENTQLDGNFFYDKIKLTVDDVLKDGILSEIEKNQIKIYFKFFLNDNNLSIKIEKIKNCLKSGKLIGNQLIELINDNTIISKIHNESQKQLYKLLERKNSIYDVDLEMIFISLTLIALLNYDGNYYNHVRDIYEKIYDEYGEQRIEGKIRDVINSFNNSDQDEYRIISSVIRNAIVPRPYLPSFLDFIFDIYKLNFNYSIDLESDLNDEFLFVYDGIKKDLNYDDDVLNLKVTSKTYKLIKTTKDLIKDDDKVEELIALSVTVLKYIDKFYWSNDDLKIDNEYFKYGFDNWKNNLDKDRSTSKNSQSKESLFKSTWEPKFKNEGSKIYLVVPNHKIKSYYDYENLSIEVTNGESTIYKNDNLKVFDIVGGYRIENEDILIDNPLGKLRYKLLCGDEVIYDSTNKLYRNYLIFKSTGVEWKNNSDYSGTVVICCKELTDDFKLMANCENYVIGFTKVKSGDCLKIKNDILNFTSIQSSGIIGREKNAKCYIKKVEIPIYEEIYNVVYESENNKKNIAVIINGQRNHLSDLVCTESKHGNYNNFIIDQSFENGLNEVIFEENIDGKYKRTNKFEFIVDSDFDYTYEQIGQREYLISIKYLNKEYPPKSISYDEDNISLIEFDDISFELPIKIPLFKLDNNSWENILDNYLWIKDINIDSKIKFYGFTFDKICITDEEGKILTTLFPVKSNYYFNLNIGTLKSYESHKYIKLDFYSENKKVGFLYCYCECVINEKQCHFWNDEISGTYKCLLSYYGKGNVFVRVLDNFQNVILEKEVGNGKEVSLDGLESFTNYKLQVVKKNKGFSLNKEVIIYEKNIVHYSVNDLVGKYFKISMINIEQSTRGKIVRYSRTLRNTFVEFIEQKDNTNFIGNLYVYKGAKQYFDKINPIEIELTSSIDNGVVEASLTKDGDGLLSEYPYYSILNTIDSKTAVDIFSYIINIERK